MNFYVAISKKLFAGLIFLPAVKNIPSFSLVFATIVDFWRLRRNGLFRGAPFRLFNPSLPGRNDRELQTTSGL